MALRAVSSIPPGTDFTPGIFFAVNYGSCTWDSTHDVGPCINAAIAAAVANGGGTVMIDAGTFGLATPIVQGASGVHIVGAGSGRVRDTLDPTKFLSVTRLIWIGAADATMLTVEPGGTQSLYSVDVTGITFDGANLAGVCAKLVQFSNSFIDIGVSEPRSIGAWLTTGAAAFTDAPGTQNNDIWIQARSTSATYLPTGILLDSGIASAWNTSFNRFHFLNAWYNKGDGIVFGNSDNNIIYDIRTFPDPNAGTGRPVVFASSLYTMPNGLTVQGFAYDSAVLHCGSPSVVEGFQAGSSIVPGVQTGSASVNTISVATNATTAFNNATLHFASTTGIVAGMVVNAGGWSSGIAPNSVVSSVTGTTVVLSTAAVGAVASGVTCVFSYGVTTSAVAGVYTITATGAATFSITAPAGGHSQSGVAYAAGIVSFTDLLLPLTGTPATNDTWTLTVPTAASNINVSLLDGANSVPTPVFENGANGFVSTTRNPYPRPYGGTGNIAIAPVGGSNNSTAIGGSGANVTGQFATAIGGAGNIASAFASTAIGHNSTASGANSLATGENSIASATLAFAAGDTTLANGINSRTGGKGSSARSQYSADIWSGGNFTTQGDAQIGRYVLRGSGASAAAIRLTADGATALAASNNSLIMPNASKYALSHEALIVDATTGEYASWTLASAGIRRGANAAATAIAATTFPSWVQVSASNATAAGWSAPSMTADTTNGCVNVSWTPPGANTDQFYVVDHIRSVEIVK